MNTTMNAPWDMKLHDALCDKYQTHVYQHLGICSQYADHSQWMGVNDGGKEEKKRRKERRFLELPRPKA